MGVFPLLIARSVLAAEPDNAAAAGGEVANPLKVSASTPAAVDYKPSMPDMMNMAILPRHEKIAIAGRERNWKYLAYEIRELRSAFARIARTAPAHDGWDTLAMFNSMIMPPIKNVEDAVKAGDARAFDTGFVALTEACNACHVVMGRDYIVVREPRGNSYPNQDFRTPRASRKK